MSKKKCILLNKTFEGAWPEDKGNIAHEIIDFFLDDNGNQYAYMQPYGYLGKEIRTKYVPKWLLLTSKTIQNKCIIYYKLNIKELIAGAANDINKMKDYITRNNIRYGGVLLSDINFNDDCPPLTFAVSSMEKPAQDEPLVFDFDENFGKSYQYQRNRGILKEDVHQETFQRLEQFIQNTKWETYTLNTIKELGNISEYQNKLTFLDLILKSKSEECYTNILYSLFRSDPTLINDFLSEYGKNKMSVNSYNFDSIKFKKISREKAIEGGRMDLSAESKDFRLVIENKIDSGLNHIDRSNHISQLSVYYQWASEKERKPLCFCLVPDYSFEKFNQEIKKFDSEMAQKYYLVKFSEMAEFIQSHEEKIKCSKPYGKYYDDILIAFQKFSCTKQQQNADRFLQEIQWAKNN